MLVSRRSIACIVAFWLLAVGCRDDVSPYPLVEGSFTSRLQVVPSNPADSPAGELITIVETVYCGQGRARSLTLSFPGEVALVPRHLEVDPKLKWFHVALLAVRGEQGSVPLPSVQGVEIPVEPDANQPSLLLGALGLTESAPKFDVVWVAAGQEAVRADDVLEISRLSFPTAVPLSVADSAVGFDSAGNASWYIAVPSASAFLGSDRYIGQLPIPVFDPSTRLDRPLTVAARVGWQKIARPGDLVFLDSIPIGRPIWLASSSTEVSLGVLNDSLGGGNDLFETQMIRALEESRPHAGLQLRGGLELSARLDKFSSVYPFVDPRSPVVEVSGLSGGVAVLLELSGGFRPQRTRLVPVHSADLNWVKELAPRDGESRLLGFVFDARAGDEVNVVLVHRGVPPDRTVHATKLK